MSYGEHISELNKLSKALHEKARLARQYKEPEALVYYYDAVYVDNSIKDLIRILHPGAAKNLEPNIEIPLCYPSK